MKRFLFSLILSVLPAIAMADFTGQVVAVVDGDTIDVLRDGAAVRIRLAEIDAPERSQPFGQRAKQALSDLCFGKVASITDTGKIHRKRLIGAVDCEGKDAGTEQVRGGMAWVYDRYAKDYKLYDLQRSARYARRGLWADAKPIPPWNWRRLP